MSETVNSGTNMGEVVAPAPKSEETAPGNRTFVVEFYDRDKKARTVEVELAADSLTEEGAIFWLRETKFEGHKRFRGELKIKSIREKK